MAPAVAQFGSGDGARIERPGIRISAMNPQAVLMRRLSSAMAVPSGGAALVWSSTSSTRIPDSCARIARGLCGVRASVGRENSQNGGFVVVSSVKPKNEYLPPLFR